MPLSSPMEAIIDAEWLSYHRRSGSSGGTGRSHNDIRTQLTPETVKQHNTTSTDHRGISTTTATLPRVIVEARDVSDSSNQRNESYLYPPQLKLPQLQQQAYKTSTTNKSGSNIDSRSRERSGQPEQRHRSQSVIRMGGRAGSGSGRSNGEPREATEVTQTHSTRRNRSHTLSPPHGRTPTITTTEFLARSSKTSMERDSVEVVLTGDNATTNDGMMLASDTHQRKQQDPVGKSTSSSKSHSTNWKSHPSSGDAVSTPKSGTRRNDIDNNHDRDVSSPQGFGFEMSPIYNKVRLREASRQRSISAGRNNGRLHPTNETTTNSNTPPQSILDPVESPTIIVDYPDTPSHSSLTSSASARREKQIETARHNQHHPHHHLRRQNKSLLQQQLQRKHLSGEAGHKGRPEPERYHDTAMLKKQRQSLLHKAELTLSAQKQVQGAPSESTEISLTDAIHGPGGIFRAVASTPRHRSLSEMSVSDSPNVIYQALRTGTSGTLSQLLVSPHNLSEALRGSTQSDGSVFGDFHNPSSTIFEHPDGEDINLPPDLSSPLSRGVERPCRTQHDDALSVVTTTSSVLKERLVLKSESRSFDSTEEMTYYHYVSRHSILQLCTEDLMSDNWKLVDYALYRLCEVCCTTNTNAAGTLSPMANRSAFDSPIHVNNDPAHSIEQQHKTAAANRIRFIKAGGHALIVGVMKKFSTVADLQTSACRLIQNLFSLDQEGAFKELFSSVYGMDCVLAAILQFSNGANSADSNHDEVHRYACGALVAIVCSSFKMVQRLMQDPRNLRIFLDAMHFSVPNESSTVGVCRVIHFISRYPDYHKAILNAGGMEEMMAEMKLFPESKKVQCTGCEALGNIVKNTRTASTAVVEHIVNQLDGAHLIGVAMKTFPEWEDLQEKGSYALFYLSAHKSVLAPMKKAAGLSVLGTALENFPHNKLIQEHGCAAMKRLLEGGSIAASSK